jgi:hypothetical protein
MTTTFQKRQKEMKRLEKQKMKEERRAQKKIENRERPAGTREVPIEPADEGPEIFDRDF